MKDILLRFIDGMWGESDPALVAVVEDDEIARAALGRLLRVGGFEPVLFGNAEAFISSPTKAAVRCLIVDVQLEGMSGLDLQTRLRVEGSRVPVIVISGNRTDAIRERANEAGCAGFLLKPFAAEAILPLVGSIIQTRPDRSAPGQL